MTETETLARPQAPWALRLLPPFPAIAHRIMALVSRDDVSIQELGKLVRMDPSFSAELLRFANSALFGACREVRRVLTAKGVEFEAVDYTRQPLTADALQQLLRRAGLRPMDAVRTREAAYKQFVAGKNLRDDDLVGLMIKHPELIQRPWVVRGKKVVLARPVERLSDLGI